MLVKEIKPNGLCGGVKRAIKLINNCLENPHTKKPIYLFGYLVHNKKIVSSYEKKVILIKNDFLNALDNIEIGTIIFTAHGISPIIKQKALQKNLDIVDTTCTKVIKIQEMIQKESKENDCLIIGNNNHPEVLGYLGISNRVKLYQNNLKINDNTFVVNQTTLIYQDVLKQFDELKKINPNIKLAEEICDATRARQNAVIKNINNFDLFIVIGDKLSNNCKSLYEIIIQNKKRAYQIEDISELNNLDFSNIKSIGVTAGASTPPKVIDEIINELKNYYPKKIFTSNLKSEDYIKY